MVQGDAEARLAGADGGKDKGPQRRGQAGGWAEALLGEPEAGLSAKVLAPDGFKGITWLPGKARASGGGGRSGEARQGNFRVRMRDAPIPTGQRD